LSLINKLESFNRIIAIGFLKLFLNNKKVDYPINILDLRRVLILRFDAIGDMVITLPMIDLLKQLNPNCIIDIIASESNSKIIEHDKRISNIYIYSGKQNRVFVDLKAATGNHYDLVLSMVYNKTSLSGIIANYLGHKSIKVNQLDENRADLYSAFFNIQIPVNEFRNQMTLLEIQLKIMEQLFNLGREDYQLNTGIVLNSSNLDFANEFIGYSNHTKRIFFNISAGTKHRMFSCSKNTQILEFLENQYSNYEIILLCSPNHRELALEIANSSSNNVRICPSTDNILDIAALISFADLIITPDTSIVHISAAMGKPVVCFYSEQSVNPVEWFPFGVENSYLISKDKLPIESIGIEEIKDSIYNFILNICR